MLSLTPQIALIEAIAQDSVDAKLFTFCLLPVSDAWLSATAGQFFMLTVPGAGEAAFTFATLPDSEGRFAALVRNVGNLTRVLFALSAGDRIGVRGPFGSPWPQVSATSQLLVVAGGCGLAPLAAFMQQRAEQAQALTQLLYSAREESHAVLARQRDDWRANGVVIDEVRDAGEHRVEVLQARAGAHVDNALQRFGRLPDAVFVCGPEAMMLAVAAHVVTRGVAVDAVFVSLERRMHCAVGSCGHCYVADSYVCREGPTYSYARLMELEASAFVGNKTTHPVAWMGCSSKGL